MACLGITKESLIPVPGVTVCAATAIRVGIIHVTAARTTGVGITTA